ncbi:MAG: YgjP-like metallopeptidase domain-containing protein [Pseudomonadota bacterium]|nr:YgjP-like metallopeptidase domain-containing protein [Pseudomonadota bacterium]
MSQSDPFRYIAHYTPELQQQISALVAANQLNDYLHQRYPNKHDIRSDAQLYQYVKNIKQQSMRQVKMPDRVGFDAQLKRVEQALGINRLTTRQHGGQLKTKVEIRIASLFQDAPADFLQMIVVHELAHLKQREHDKAFYRLCQHLLPNYHQLELDTRLWLMARELAVEVL